MRSPNKWCSAASLLAVALLAASCGGGGGGGGGGVDSDYDPSNDLVLLDVNVADFDGVAVNQALKFTFSEDLDPDSVRPETIQIRAGPQFGKQVFGNFLVDGATVHFYPRLPTLDDLSDGGFQPGTTYKIFLPSVPKVATVRNYTADRTMRETEEYFQTAASDDPNVYVDNFLDPSPPKIESVNPVDGAIEVPAGAAITLTFNRRPLNPVSVSRDNIRLRMLTRKGKVFDRSVPGEPVLSQTRERVAVVFTPDFPLADDAVYELTVSNRVEDLVGFSIQSFKSKFTIRDEPYRTSTFRLAFTEQEKADYADIGETTASWNGYVTNALAALFTLSGGSGKSGDLITSADMNMTPTTVSGVQTGVYEDGVFYTIYNFRKIEIADGATVSFESSVPEHPVKVLALFPMKIDGVITVSGGNGETCASYYNGTKLPRAWRGGKQGPGGAAGADSYAGTKFTNIPSADGDDVEDASGDRIGGGGGYGGGSGTMGYAYATYRYYYAYTAGGGGGGASRLKGTDGLKGGYPSTGYFGLGGKGGAAAPAGNEERAPNVGGAGGGAGGCGFYRYIYTNSSGTIVGYSTYYTTWGAGGGGGGGGVWLQCASSIIVGTTGQILADGGNGGGTNGYYAYSGGPGGGGGAGSIKLMSTSGVTLESGATLSVAGGQGGPCNYTYYNTVKGGDGGDGYLRLEAPELNMVQGVSGAVLTYTPPSTGIFRPQGPGVPSVGQTKWINLGVFDPEMLPHRPLEDRYAELQNDSMSLYVQMADEHPTKAGEPDLSEQDIANDGTYDENKLSKWVLISDMDDLTGNGYQFIRIRVIFQLDEFHYFDDQLPYLDWLDIRFRY